MFLYYWVVLQEHGSTFNSFPFYSILKYQKLTEFCHRRSYTDKQFPCSPNQIMRNLLRSLFIFLCTATNPLPVSNLIHFLDKFTFQLPPGTHWHRLPTNPSWSVGTSPQHMFLPCQKAINLIMIF